MKVVTEATNQSTPAGNSTKLTYVREVLAEGPRAPFTLVFPQNVDRYVPRLCTPSSSRQDGGQGDQGAGNNSRSTPFTLAYPPNVDRYVPPPPLSSPGPSRNSTRSRCHAKQDEKATGPGCGSNATRHKGYGTPPSGGGTQPFGADHNESCSGSLWTLGEKDERLSCLSSDKESTLRDDGAEGKGNARELPRDRLVLQDIPGYEDDECPVL